MAITAPSVTDFKARYAAFLPVADTRVALILSDAVDAVNTNWMDADIPRGIMAFAAHTLTMEGEPDATAIAAAKNSGDTDTLLGPVKRFTVGDVIEEYDTARSDAGSISDNARTAGAGLASTIYGQDYLRFARRNTPTFIAV